VPLVVHSAVPDGAAHGSGAGAGAAAGAATGGGATALTLADGSTVAPVATTGLVTIGTTTGAVTAGVTTAAAGASAGAVSTGTSWVGTTTGAAATAAAGTATAGVSTMPAPSWACATPTKAHDVNAATQTLVLTFIAASIPKLLDYDCASETNPNARSGLTRSTLAIGEVLTIQSGPRGQSARTNRRRMAAFAATPRARPDFSR